VSAGPSRAGSLDAVTGPDSRGDGDGWIECGLGHRHWGLFGAAGVLLHRPGPGGREVLLQHRATWSHHGGTWGLLGGARHSDESAVSAALREAAEEGGLSPQGLEVQGRYDDDHGGWSYATVLVAGTASTVARPTGGESIDVAWVPVDAVAAEELHPGFGRSWPLLRPTLGPVTVVVDAANVVGSRPDGWWRDRPGAARRLVAACHEVARGGVPGADLPPETGRQLLTRVWPRVVVVVEGAARAATDSATEHVEVVAASGSGDDAIVDVAAERRDDGPVVVVTADRELRTRAAVAGADAVGPRWLTDRIPG
jgi:8-oxo-dGTP pyrophosphatase MutT (NUDIX family)